MLRVKMGDGHRVSLPVKGLLTKEQMLEALHEQQIVVASCRDDAMFAIAETESGGWISEAIRNPYADEKENLLIARLDRRKWAGALERTVKTLRAHGAELLAPPREFADKQDGQEEWQDLDTQGAQAGASRERITA